MPVMVDFIDAHRGEFGVEPICAQRADRPFHLLRRQVEACVAAGPPPCGR